MFDSMYAANVVEGDWKARTNIDAVGRLAALLEEVRRSNDIHLIHVKGHSADGGNDRADELAWWGKEGRRSVDSGREEEKGRAGMGRRRTTRRARSGARRRRWRLHERPLMSKMLWRPHERPLRWEALLMRRKGVLAEPPSERALRLTWLAWRGALPKMICVIV